MYRTLSLVVVFLALISNAFAVTVETLDEQLNSQNMTVLRLRINNDTEKDFYNVKVKYFIQGNAEHPVVDIYDYGGTRISLDSINENIWSVTIAIDTLPPGIYPYESGLCIGIHNATWQSRDKYRDPSYIASPAFVINERVELNINGNHLPNAEPLTLVSGTKMLINEGDSVPFAWHHVPNAEKYRLTIYSLDSQQVYQKEIYGYSESVALDAGDYLWKVEAKNSMTDYGAGGSGSLVNYLTVKDFLSATILEQETHGIESVSGHKDTPMLVVGWGEYADLREWDKPHQDRAFLDENEAYSCWAIAIKNLNYFYGGNLSLDEIRWYVKKNYHYDSINAFGFWDEAKGVVNEIKTGLKYALDSTKEYKHVSHKKQPLTYDEVKKSLTNNQEIYICMCWNEKSCHAMLIDAFYTTSEGNFVRCVNIDNRGNYGYFLADSLFTTMYWYIIIDPPETVRNMDSLLGVEKYNQFNTWIKWTDTDGDGITDFDEIYRFGTNPGLADSDSDGVNDKDEIYSYTILEKSRLNLTGSHVGKYADLTQMPLIAGIKNEYMADVDGDELRAELDPDSDNDGLLDGEDPEPFIKNGANNLKTNELPKDVVLYALKQLSVNDGTTCVNSTQDLCSYVSEDHESNYGILMGARASAAYLYAKNNVLIRSNSDNTFLVNYYGPNNLATDRPDGKMTIDRHFDINAWPWKLNIALPPFDEGDSILVVHRGENIILSTEDHFKKLKVESGGIVYFPEGNLYVGDLQLDAESFVKFSKPNFETNLYVKNKSIWRGTFSTYQGIDQSALARGFRFFYYGNDRIFIETNWNGTIIAPKAKIVLGQTHKKLLYGQFYANEIVIHQYSHLQNVPFDPEKTQLEHVFNIKTQKRGRERI